MAEVTIHGYASGCYEGKNEHGNPKLLHTISRDVNDVTCPSCLRKIEGEADKQIATSLERLRAARATRLVSRRRIREIGA